MLELIGNFAVLLHRRLARVGHVDHERSDKAPVLVDAPREGLREAQDQGCADLRAQIWYA